MLRTAVRRRASGVSLTQARHQTPFKLMTDGMSFYMIGLLVQVWAQPPCRRDSKPKLDLTDSWMHGAARDKAGPSALHHSDSRLAASVATAAAPGPRNILRMKQLADVQTPTR